MVKRRLPEEESTQVGAGKAAGVYRWERRCEDGVGGSQEVRLRASSRGPFVFTITMLTWSGRPLMLPFGELCSL